jgi:hypothetical protein
MCCTTSIAQGATATTQLIHAARYGILWSSAQQEREYRAVRMNWVVVTDGNGSRQLRMCWRADRQRRPIRID